MLSLIFCTLLLSGLISAESVVELTDASFKPELETMETALVMFYAPWCGHCKKLKPEFEKAAGILLSNDPPVSLAKVDCTEGGKDTCNQFEVRGYPTLKIFRNGEVSADYNGPREAGGIVKYMKSQVGPASRELKSVADAEKELAKNEVVVYFLGEEGTDLAKTFHKVSDKMRENVAFAHSSDSEVAKKIGQAAGTVVLVRPKHLQSKFEDSQVVYSGSESDKAALEEFVNKNYHGLCGHRSTDNARDFKTPLVTAYFNVDYVKNTKGTNYWRNRILKVVKDLSTSYNFAISNKDDFQHELSEFGVDYVSGDKPVVVARDASNQKFKMTDEFSMETFEVFMNSLEAGELEPYLKSEPVPDNSANSVKVAVAKNFDELVTKSEKDVLVEFYAPWCGHCKKLAPVFDELGDKMKDEDVEIVKMDATANDVPAGYDVRGFPTLFWLPKDSKKAKSYEGGRELSDFVDYIAEHATDELKGWDRKGKEKKVEL